jgi:hypothetical protein
VVAAAACRRLFGLSNDVKGETLKKADAAASNGGIACLNGELSYGYAPLGLPVWVVDKEYQVGITHPFPAIQQCGAVGRRGCVTAFKATAIHAVGYMSKDGWPAAWILKPDED